MGLLLGAELVNGNAKAANVALLDADLSRTPSPRPRSGSLRP